MSNLWDVIKICASCIDRSEMIFMQPPKVVSTGQDPTPPFPLKSNPLLYFIDIHIWIFMVGTKISNISGCSFLLEAGGLFILGVAYQNVKTWILKRFLLVNFMDRKREIGSGHLICKYEMQTSEKAKVAPKVAIKLEEGQSQSHEPPQCPWDILRNKRTVREVDMSWQILEPLQSSFEIAILQEIQRNFTELRNHEIKSLRNYLSLALNQKDLVKEQKVKNYLFLMVYLFSSSCEKLQQKLRKELKATSIRYVQQNKLLKPSRNKKEFCFSNNFKVEENPTFYLLFQTFHKQAKFARVWILDQYGFIIKSYCHKKDLFKELCSEIFTQKEHLKNLVIICNKGQEVDLDIFQSFRAKLKNKNVFMLCYRKREDLALIRQGAHVKTLKQCPAKDTYLSFCDSKSVLICSNRLLNQETMSLLAPVYQTVVLEARVSRVFRYQNQQQQYSSVHFIEYEKLLRFFAFIFNFNKIENMDLENPDHFIEHVVEKEISDIKYQEKKREENMRHPNLHFYQTHPKPNMCVVCKHRTKIKCQNCCTQFSRTFGLCKIDCFQIFHANPSEYQNAIYRGKKGVISQKEESSDDDEEYMSLYQKGNKKVKKQSEVNISKPTQKHVQVTSIEQNKQKWMKEERCLNEQFRDLELNTELGIFSEGMIARLKYLMNETSTISVQSKKEGYEDANAMKKGK